MVRLWLTSSSWWNSLIMFLSSLCIWKLVLLSRGLVMLKFHLWQDHVIGGTVHLQEVAQNGWLSQFL
jgi:hypothetical protein